MGNENIKEIKIENLPKQGNDLIITEMSGDTEKEKEREKDAVNNEKQNMKLITKHNKEHKDADLIENCLIDHSFLRSLEKQARQEVIKQVSSYSVKSNVEIFKQGNEPGCFYILAQGTCEKIVNGQKTELIEKGQYFGDTALLYGTNREYTVRTSDNCIVWCMEKKNFRKVIEHILHVKFEENKNNVNNMPLFAVINNEQKNKVIGNIYRETHLANKPIYTKNNVSNCIYIMRDGTVNLKKDGKAISTLKEGDYFGVIEALGLCNRLCDAVPKEKCHVFSVPLYWLKNLYGNNYRSILALSIIKSAFFKCKCFNKFNLKLFDEIFKYFNIKYYENETEILKKGESKNSHVVIPIEGELVDDSDKKLCSKGSLLYGDELYNEDSSKISSSIKCVPFSLVAMAKTTDITKHFGCSFKVLGDKSSSIDQLKRVNLFKNFTNAKLENLSKKIKCEKISDGQNVITQGEEGTRFYIVKKGLVDIFVNDKYIRTMNENEYLGERALFFKEPRSATAKAHGDCEVYYLEKEEFEKVIERNLKEYLIGRLYLQDNTVQLSDLTYYIKLGSGSYGNVSLVKSAKNKYFYAIKNISNKQILYNQLYTNLELERAILLQIDHPFIVKLVKTLKDTKYIYFLMDYIKGKELFDVIRDIGLLNKFQTQFYGGSMMLAVQYLHERKFIFRDIKPENIMVLDNGFIKLIDFGTAKAITDRTKTIIGTPHYMAPEVILGEGYTFKVDYWSIGICMYEFMCGGVPFGENQEEAMDVYLAIINE